MHAWLSCQEGAVATEYAILVGFLAMMLVVGATALGAALNQNYRDVADIITGWIGG